ncbi:hypothetical protein CDD83_2046 [Cordyceps sp. RAO-2017]|nr:hypothetical protein CDD83_2046 [Cordyceps sp. RAO-2017]
MEHNAARSKRLRCYFSLDEEEEGKEDRRSSQHRNGGGIAPSPDGARVEAHEKGSDSCHEDERPEEVDPANFFPQAGLGRNRQPQKIQESQKGKDAERRLGNKRP